MGTDPIARVSATGGATVTGRVPAGMATSYPTIVKC